MFNRWDVKIKQEVTDDKIGIDLFKIMYRRNEHILKIIDVFALIGNIKMQVYGECLISKDGGCFE